MRHSDVVRCVRDSCLESLCVFARALDRIDSVEFLLAHKSMNYDPLATQIAKTGFVLENRIAQALKAAKWTVISNRYYVDDAEESIREIDLVAYQARRVQHFDVYTTLIISCKKNEVCAWALLARGIDLKDPNSDWHPLHAWSNDKALTYKLAGVGCAKRYHEEISRLGVGSVLQTPAVEVFAFQEMNKTSGAPQNDKNIFAAVTSLMKAQAYEMGALPQRKKSPSVYQFNFLSIVDTELVRIMFSGKKIDAVPVESEHYIARYIIKKRETFSRIRFISADSFASTIPEYGALHSANCKWFASECDAFYRDIVKDRNRVNVLIDDFRKRVGFQLRWALNKKELKGPEPSLVTLVWDEEQSLLQVCAPLESQGAILLNADTFIKTQVARALKSIYRYSGPFEFVDDGDIPF